MFTSTSYDSGDGKSDTVSTSGTKWKGKKTYTHLDFHMLCSQEANIIPWMLVIKQCAMDNCYELSLFRQVFFLLNKPLKGLKYNHSQLSTRKFFPSTWAWTIPRNWPLLPSWSESLSTEPGDRVLGETWIQGRLRSWSWQGCWAHGQAESCWQDFPHKIEARLCMDFNSEQQEPFGVCDDLKKNNNPASVDGVHKKRKKMRGQLIWWDCRGPAEKFGSLREGNSRRHGREKPNSVLSSE